MTNAETWLFLKTNASILWAVVSFIGGLFIGNRQAIGRDRRKEWNELTRDSYRGLRRQIESNGQEGGLSGDLDIIETYIPTYKKFFYKRCLRTFLESQKDRYGPYDPVRGADINPEQCAYAAICAKKLFRYFQPR